MNGVGGGGRDRQSQTEGDRERETKTERLAARKQVLSQGKRLTQGRNQERQTRVLDTPVILVHIFWRWRITSSHLVLSSIQYCSCWEICCCSHLTRSATNTPLFIMCASMGRLAALTCGLLSFSTRPVNWNEGHDPESATRTKAAGYRFGYPLGTPVDRAKGKEERPKCPTGSSKL